MESENCLKWEKKQTTYINSYQNDITLHFTIIKWGKGGNEMKEVLSYLQNTPQNTPHCFCFLLLQGAHVPLTLVC